MAGENSMTLVGNLVDEVELRFTPNGAAVAKFRVASTPRKFNRDSNAWEDDKDNALFLNCQVWRQQAEHCAETLAKGMRVIVQGRLKQRSYEDREGVRRTVMELEVEEIGPSLKMATAAVTKTSGSGKGQEAYRQASRQTSQEARQDPWASGVPGTQPAGAWGGPGASGGQGGGYSDEAPF